MLKIDIDPGAGFCFGVDEVIKTAEMHLKQGETLYGLGEMVHNDSEVQRLQKLGLKTIDHKQLEDLPPGKVLFRAHGEPPETYALAERNGIDFIDGTCPIVSRLQTKLQKAYQEMDREKEQLLIFGKSDHPETIGLMGQVGGDAIVIHNVDDVNKIDPTKKVRLFSQTTMDPDRFEEVEKAIREFLHSHDPELEIDAKQFNSQCTVCGQMKKRKPSLSTFARQYDLMLFVSGKKSSNGRMLYEYCKSINPNTYWVSIRDEVKKEWFEDARSIGISGATSTSRMQLERVMEEVKKLMNS